jgi:hypothetical protein
MGQKRINILLVIQKPTALDGVFDGNIKSIMAMDSPALIPFMCHPSGACILAPQSFGGHHHPGTQVGGFHRGPEPSNPSPYDQNIRLETPSAPLIRSNRPFRAVIFTNAAGFSATTFWFCQFCHFLRDS